MKLKTITYSESRETVDARGLKQWRKIGVEAELEEGEDYEGAWGASYYSAKELVEKWHKEVTPNAYFTEPETLPVIQTNDR